MPHQARVVSWIRKPVWEEHKDGPARCAGDDLHLLPGADSIRPQEDAGTGSQLGKSPDRVSQGPERTEVHVRTGNENPGTGNRIVEGNRQRSHQSVSVRYLQLRLFVV